MMKKIFQMISLLSLVTTPALADVGGFRTEIARCTSEIGASGLSFDVSIQQNTETGSLHASGTILTQLTGLVSRIEIYPLSPSDSADEEGTSSQTYMSWVGGFRLNIDHSKVNVNGAFATLSYQGEKHALRCKLPQY